VQGSVRYSFAGVQLAWRSTSTMLEACTMAVLRYAVWQRKSSHTLRAPNTLTAPTVCPQPTTPAQLPHLWLWDHVWPQAVVTNGTRHRQHTHHAVAVPVQHLAPSLLNTLLQHDTSSTDVCGSQCFSSRRPECPQLRANHAVCMPAATTTSNPPASSCVCCRTHRLIFPLRFVVVSHLNGPATPAQHST
jgi:hypothetical protein